MKYKLVSFACDQTDLRDFFQKSKQAQPVHNLAGWLWLHAWPLITDGCRIINADYRICVDITMRSETRHIAVFLTTNIFAVNM